MLLFWLCERDLNRTKCRCPVDICLPPAGRRQLLDSLKFLSLRPVRQLSWSDGRQIASPTPRIVTTQKGMLLFWLRERDLNRTKCRCPVDICLPPAGRRQLLDSLKFLSLRPVRQLSWSDGRQIASPTPKKKSGRQIAAPTQKRWEPGGSKVYHILQKIPRVGTRGIIFRFILTDRPLRPGALPWSGCTRLRPSSRRACPGGRLDADPGPPAPGS